MQANPDSTIPFTFNAITFLFTGCLVLGFITLLSFLVSLFGFVSFYLLHTSTLSRCLRAPYCNWALVTGASDGVGVAFVRELASRGFNVVLHGRNPSKLDKLIAKLQQEFPQAKFKYVIADAGISHGMKSNVESIAAAVTDEQFDEGEKLTVLINNIGGGLNIFTDGAKPFRTFVETPAADIDTLYNVNARFMTQLTRAILPMLCKKGRGPSLVMNISSLGAHAAPPYLPVYTGSKAYLNTFSASLANEMHDLREQQVRMQPSSGDQAISDVEVLCLTLGEVADTQYLDGSSKSFFIPTATAAAKACFERVGCGVKGPVAADWTHGLQLLFLQWSPDWVVSLAARKSMRTAIEKAIHDGRAKRGNILKEGRTA